MKEQKKSTSKVIVRSALILLLLTLISGCFLGSTFARYVSKGEGDLSAGVAEWKITETVSAGEGGIVTGLEKFSPNMAKYDGSNKRSRSVNVTLLTIKNDGDLDAYVKVAFDSPASEPTQTVALYSDEAGETELVLQNVTDRGEGEANEYAPYVIEINEIFTLTTTISITNGTDEGAYSNSVISSEGSEYNGMYYLEVGETMTITGTITWTTDLEDETPTKVAGWPEGVDVYNTDLRDTWIGEHVKAIGWNYTWYALQASEAPTTGGTSNPTPAPVYPSNP